MTASMVKGAAAGNLIAESIKKALDWAKEWTLGAAEHAAHTDKMSLASRKWSGRSLTKAHGVSAEASNKAVEAVKKGRLRHAGCHPCGRPAHDRGHKPVKSGGQRQTWVNGDSRTHCGGARYYSGT